MFMALEVPISNCRGRSGQCQCTQYAESDCKVLRRAGQYNEITPCMTDTAASSIKALVNAGSSKGTARSPDDKTLTGHRLGWAQHGEHLDDACQYMPQTSFGRGSWKCEERSSIATHLQCFSDSCALVQIIERLPPFTPCARIMGLRQCI